MRAVLAVVTAGAILASAAWTAALPPPPVEDRGLPLSRVRGEDDAFPQTIVDPLGRAMTVPAPPRRIVSLALSDDEILLALGLAPRVAGFTYLVDDPSSTPSARLAPVTAARVTEENPEEVLSLRPDLVFTAGYTRAEAIATLEAAGVPVVGTGAHATLADVVTAVRTLGRAVGERGVAEELARSVEARVAAVEERIRGHASARATEGSRRIRNERPRVLVWEDGFTYAKGTLVDDVVTRAGGVNVASVAGLGGAVSLTEEAAVALAPDVVIVPVEQAEPRLHARELVGDAPVWSAVAAVRRGEVHGVPRAWIGSVSLPVVRALELIASILESTSAAGRVP
jgi:iron complex transport system substrate-binding protein